MDLKDFAALYKAKKGSPLTAEDETFVAKLSVQQATELSGMFKEDKDWEAEILAVKQKQKEKEHKQAQEETNEKFVDENVEHRRIEATIVATPVDAETTASRDDEETVRAPNEPEGSPKDKDSTEKPVDKIQATEPSNTSGAVADVTAEEALEEVSTLLDDISGDDEGNKAHRSREVQREQRNRVVKPVDDQAKDEQSAALEETKENKLERTQAMKVMEQRVSEEVERRLQEEKKHRVEKTFAERLPAEMSSALEGTKEEGIPALPEAEKAELQDDAKSQIKAETEKQVEEEQNQRDQVIKEACKDQDEDLPQVATTDGEAPNKADTATKSQAAAEEGTSTTKAKAAAAVAEFKEASSKTAKAKSEKEVKVAHVPEPSTTMKRKLALHETPKAKRRRASPTVAEKIQQYHRRTPPRFRSMPRGQSAAPVMQQRPKPAAAGARVTVPKAFNLSIGNRSSSRLPPVSQDQDPAVAPSPSATKATPSAAQATPSAAQATPSAAQSSGPAPRMTVPQPFALSTSSRARSASVAATPAAPRRPPPFKATPLNKKILTSIGQYGIPVVQKRQSTAPQEFGFMKREAARLKAKIDAEAAASQDKENVINSPPDSQAKRGLKRPRAVDGKGMLPPPPKRTTQRSASAVPSKVPLS